MTKSRPPFELFSGIQLERDHHHGIEPLFTADEIHHKIGELADQIAPLLSGGDAVAQVVMNGAMMFASDLARALSVRGIVLEMDFLKKDKDRKTGCAVLSAMSDRPVEGRNVLIIDDIFETGKTLAMAEKHFLALGANSVVTVALLDKSNGKDTLTKPDFYGFSCPNIFVIGYGMDLGYKYRELPFVGRMGQA